MTYAGYKRIQRIAQTLVARLMQRGDLPPASGPCTDCGAGRYFVWDHRSYSDMKLEAVCFSCNELRGPASIDFWNVETLDMVRVTFKWLRRRPAA